MKEFIFAALPFIIIGICLAIIFANYKKEKDEKNYLAEGMCFGMCAGVVFSSVLHINMGLGTSMGVLIGETIGILIKKK